MKTHPPQHHDNSEQPASHHGQPPLSWDHDLNFTTADSSSALLDTSFPLATSSSFPNLISTGNDFYDTTNWNTLPLSAAGDLLAMAPTTNAPFDMSTSIPMEPIRSQSGSSANSYSPEQSPHARLTTSTKSSPPTEPPSKIEKRKANTLAARRYRQKRVDQMSGLEAELKEVKADRDEWKVRCAKLEGEVEALRALLRAQK
ncbi:hypothetical protein N0V91_007537 [Didymella pomorum]|uniref:BZIP domain-containing protein n=1 Tax=Didymella pomorum TaxID=749634 RepID=A0A9W9D4U1_9PLEO|nr:hypothetical protein N0V91_007537 [Didymella pomorum]